MIKNLNHWAWLLLFGSLWGISEVIFGEVLLRNSVPYASVWLTAWAVFVLAVARGIQNKPGTSTLIGTLAAVFKLVNAAPFFCHLLGIFILGFTFDVVSTVLLKHERKFSYRSALTGAVSTYSGYALFALVITYIVRYEYWTAGGLAKVLNYIFVDGSFAALVAIVIVPLGFWLGVNKGIIVENRPQWAFPGALVISVALWTVVRVLG